MSFENNNFILNNIDILEASGAILSVAGLIACTAAEEASGIKGRVPSSKNVLCKRVNVEDIIKQLGKKNFRRAYRMKVKSFRVLLDLIKPYMKVLRKRKRGKTLNGCQ